jgi:hypothetical protein
MDRLSEGSRVRLPLGKRGIIVFSGSLTVPDVTEELELADASDLPGSEPTKKVLWARFNASRPDRGGFAVYRLAVDEPTITPTVEGVTQSANDAERHMYRDIMRIVAAREDGRGHGPAASDVWIEAGIQALSSAGLDDSHEFGRMVHHTPERLERIREKDKTRKGKTGMGRAGVVVFVGTETLRTGASIAAEAAHGLATSGASVVQYC